MATLYTTFATAQKRDRVNTARLPAPLGKNLRVIQIPYTLVGDEDDAEPHTLVLGYLPAGIIPIPAMSSVTCSADPGSALTIDLGSEDDPDGWADGMVLDSGGQVLCTTPAIPAYMAKTELAADDGYSDVAITCTIVTSTTLTAAVILYFTLAYEQPE